MLPTFADAGKTGTAELIVALTRQALDAPDVPSAVAPLLHAFVTRTAADGSAYFQVDGMSYHARATLGAMPSGPVMESILTHGLPGDTPLMRALTTTDVALFFDDTRQSGATAGFPELDVASLAAAPVHGQSGRLVGAFLMHTFAPQPLVRDRVGPRRRDGRCDGRTHRSPGGGGRGRGGARKRAPRLGARPRRARP